MTTRWHKKLVSYSFITVLSIILLFNVFITLWIMTAIGLNSSGLPRNGLSLSQVYLVKFVCDAQNYQNNRLKKIICKMIRVIGPSHKSSLNMKN